MNELQQKEIREALAAAQETLELLEQAKALLDSAGNWGLWDMLGGGMLVTYMKHSKMNKAQETMEQAKRSVLRLQKELRDVDRTLDVSLHVDDFLRFADYFFDGLIADWLVQSRIQEAKEQVTEAKRIICRVMDSLRSL